MDLMTQSCGLGRVLVSAGPESESGQGKHFAIPRVGWGNAALFPEPGEGGVRGPQSPSGAAKGRSLPPQTLLLSPVQNSSPCTVLQSFCAPQRNVIPVLSLALLSPVEKSQIQGQGLPQAAKICVRGDPRSPGIIAGVRDKITAPYFSCNYKYMYNCSSFTLFIGYSCSENAINQSAERNMDWA